MKQFIILLSITFILNNGMAQNKIDEEKTNYTVIGFHAGYDFKISAPIAGIQIGYKLGNVYTSFNTIIPVTSNSLAPMMFVGNLGLNVGSFQPFVSYGSHSISKVTEAYFSHTTDAYKSGFHFGLGVSYYPVTIPLCFTLQRTGKETIFNLTLYKAL